VKLRILGSCLAIVLVSVLFATTGCSKKTYLTPYTPSPIIQSSETTAQTSSTHNIPTVLPVIHNLRVTSFSSLEQKTVIPIQTITVTVPAHTLSVDGQLISVYPENGANNVATRPNFAWDALLENTCYCEPNSEWERGFEFRIFEGIEASPAALIFTIENCYSLDYNLENNTIYTWQVRAIASDSYGGRFSGEWITSVFVTAAVIPESTKPPSPPQLPTSTISVQYTDIRINPIFSWDSIDGYSVNYDFQISKDINFESGVLLATTTQNVLNWDSNLEYNTTYYWRVRAITKSFTTEWVTSAFTTENTPQASSTTPITITKIIVD
jgi:hypothetical protein